MLIGVGRVLWGLVASMAVYVLYGVLLPIVVMYVVLMICKFIPLVGRTPKSEK